MTSGSVSGAAVSAELLPARVLTLAEQTTRFRDRLATFQFNDPLAPDEALAHAEAAAQLAFATKAVAREVAESVST
ncbi:hypothetical protein [Streptomyces sp. NPDC003036]|uniref:hypothetical protein n=1 Tax=Streptomyces sp. NPDC003036 TaxID=3154442 RepID=UPI0033AC5F8D